MHVPQADYDLEGFCEAIFEADQSRLFDGSHFNHIKNYSYITESDDWEQFFGEGYQSEDFGEITKLTASFTKRSGEVDEAKFYVAYYENDLLMVFTSATENAINQTVEQTVLESNAIVEIPIVPSDFQEMHHRVLEEYEDTKITEFKSRRIPDLADAEIRPDYDRTIEYKGDDGRRTLEEFKEYYGVVPTRIQYESPEIEFKMDTSGKFTLKKVNGPTFNLFFLLIKEVMDHVLDIKDKSQRIRFSTESRESGEINIQIPDITAGEISFNKEFNRLMAEEFMDRAAAQDQIPFSFTNVSLQAGSLDFSASVTDEARNAFFNISATEESMTIVPKHNCASPSIVKFYQFITHTLDESADISLFNKEAAYGARGS